VKDICEKASGFRGIISSFYPYIYNVHETKADLPLWEKLLKKDCGLTIGLSEIKGKWRGVV